MSSKIIAQLALWKTKAIVNTYTWTTLPFYAIAHRPWARIKKSRHFNVQKNIRKDGKIVYTRPMVALDSSKYPILQHSTIPEVLDNLQHHHEVIGVRDVHDEFVATDHKSGEHIKIDGKILRKMKLADQFRYLKMGDALEQINSLAKGLTNGLGAKAGDHVLIYADNSVQWFYSALAILKMRGVLVTLFSTLGDSGILHGLNQSDSRFVITSEDLLPKLAGLGSKLLHAKNIVYIRGRCDAQKTQESIAMLEKNGIKVSTYDEIEDIGRKVDMKFEPPSEKDTAVIMYTSGTTGEPKGVLISHGQLVHGIRTMMHIDEEINNLAFGKQYAAFLPLSHLFGFVINIAGFCSHSKIAFCSPMTLLDSSPAHVDGQIGDLKLIQPEFFIAVPLLCERIISEIYRKLASNAPVMIPIFTYLMDYKIRWTARGYQTPILDRLVCNKIAQQFGGKLKLIAVSSAPLNVRTHALVQAALNVKVVNAYGATETCGGTHMSHIDDLNLGNCGVPFTEFYLEDWSDGGYHITDTPNPRGEIVVGGGSISSGYYKLDDETKKAFYTDENGVNWYRTGDIGEILPNGTLKLIDRKKDLIKLANGEFISLGKIESALRNSQFVENVAVCTNPYSSNIIAIVSPNRKAVAALAERLAIKYTNIEELCDNPKVVEHTFASMKKHCKENGFKIREIPSLITLVKEEWTPNNSMLTAAFKLKRKSVYNFYQKKIDDMFEQLKNNSVQNSEKNIDVQQRQQEQQPAPNV